MLPYPFPELSTFATVADLITHLRTSDTRLCAALPTEFCAKNPPPMYWTLHFLVTRLLDTLSSVRDYFLARSPTDLTVDLLEEHLLAAEKSIVAIGAARGAPRTPIFDGPLVLLLLLVGGAREPRAAEVAPGGVQVEEVEEEEVAEGLVVGVLAGVVASVAVVEAVAVEGVAGGDGSGGGGGGGGRGGGGGGGGGGGRGGGTGAGQRQQQQQRPQTSQQLREWLAQRGKSGGGGRCPYVIRTGDRKGQTCNRFHTQHCCFSCLDDAWHEEMGDEYERPRWRELWKAGVDVFALDFDAIISAMHALEVSADGDCYLCMPPDPGIEPATLGASESALSGTEPAEALHTFTLDSVPSGSLSGLHLPSFSMNLVSNAALQDVRVNTFTPAWQRVAICTVAPCRTRLFSGTTVWVTPPCHVFVACTVASLCLVFTLPGSPQQNGVAERRIGLVMEVSRTFLIHVAAPHFLWPFAVRYAAQQLNLWPRVSLPETSPTLRWTGKVGDASCFRVWGARALVRDTSVDKLSSRTIPCVFLGFVPDPLGWQFYHPTSRRVIPSQNVTCDESAPFYRLFPYRTAPLPPLPLFLAPGPPPVDPLLSQGLAPSGVSQVDPPPLAEPVEVTIDSGAAAGGAAGGAASGGAEPARGVLGSAELGGAELVGAEPGGAESADVPLVLVSPRGARTGGNGAAGTGTAPGAGGAGFGGAAAGGTGLGGPAAGAVDPGIGDPGTGGAGFGGAAAGGTRAGGLGAGTVDPGIGDPGARGAGSGGAATGGPGVGPVDPGVGNLEAGGAGTGGAAAGGAGARGSEAAGGARAGGAGAGGAGAGGSGATGGAGAGGAAAGGAGAGGSGATGGAGATGTGGSAPSQLFFALPSPSSLPPPDSVLHQTDWLTERREPASRPATPVRARRKGSRVPHERPPPVPGTHPMALRPSSVPQRVPLPSPATSSLPSIPDPESHLVRAAHPTVTCLLATVVTDPSFESAAASALMYELVDFAAACRLDFAASLVAESESVCPPSVGGECALGTDVLEDRQEDFECLAATAPHLVAILLAPEGDPDAPDIPTPRSYAEAIAGEYSSQWQTAMDVEMASWKSTGTCVDAIRPPGANVVDGMWIFRGKRPPGSPPVFKARYIARGFSQRQGRDYELHSLDFSTAFLQGSQHEEIWLRRPPGFTGSFPPGTQWSLRRPVYGLCQAPREWHNTLRTTLAALGFAPSTADSSLFLRTDTSLPPFYILVYVDDLVFTTADTEALAHMKSEPQKRYTCTDLGEQRSYLVLQITWDRARRTITLTQSHMVQQVLQCFGFTWSSPQHTPLATGHSLSAPPSDESVEPSGPYPELVGCLMYLMTCTRPDLAYPLGLLARYVAPGRHRKVHMDAAKRVLRYLCSTSGMGLVLGGRSPVVLTGHSDPSWVDDLATQRSSQGYTFSHGFAMAAQELRWLTYLLTNLGERPRSPPVMYVENKAAIALCQDHRLEHRTKHIALRYFLAQELQQRGQLCVAHVPTRANTADVFTKALPAVVITILFLHCFS
ncbi:unnamed protein product [Closterium sp. NIES-53]